MQFFRPAVVWK